MTWTIEFEDRAVKALKKMGKVEAGRVRDFLRVRVRPLANPRQIGRALEGVERGHLWRYRVGDYRIICDIQDARVVVLVIEIGHRSQVYR